MSFKFDSVNPEERMASSRRSLFSQHAFYNTLSDWLDDKPRERQESKSKSRSRSRGVRKVPLNGGSEDEKSGFDVNALNQIKEKVHKTS